MAIHSVNGRSARRQMASARERPVSIHTMKEDLAEQGFAFAHGRDVLSTLGSGLDWAFSELLEACHALPPDPHALNGCRFRRYGRYTALPWCSVLIARPVSTYNQASGFNPQDGDTARRLPELTPGLRHNEFLRRLMLHDLEQLSLNDDQRSSPLDVGVHLVRMVATPSRPGTSSPNCLHKDGEPWTYVHLLDRDGVQGGESVVADNNKSIVFETTLDQVLDTLVVDDARVYHMVREVRALPGRERGFRTALLIDFTPLKPELAPLPTAS